MPRGSSVRAWQPEDLKQIVIPHNAQISPDGRMVAYEEHALIPEWDGAGCVVKLLYLDKNHQVIGHGDACGGHSPQWSPDGTQLAMLGEENVPARQRVGGYTTAQHLRIIDFKAQDRFETSDRVVTSGPNDIIDFAWAPNGKSIVLSVAKMTPDDPKATRTGRKQSALPRVRTITKPGFSLDTFARTADDSAYLGYTYEFSYDLEILSIRGTRANRTYERRSGTTTGSNSSPSWSPDGTKLAFVAESGDSDQPRGDIWVADEKFHGFTKLSLDPSISAWSKPQWSPDGKKILFMGSRYPNWEGHQGIFVMNANGSGLFEVTADMPFTAGDQGLDDLREDSSDLLEWADDNSLVFTASENGSVQIKRIELTRNRTAVGKVSDLTSGEQRLYGASRSKDGTLALCVSSWTNPGDIWVQSPGQEPMRVTEINDKLLSARITHVPEPLAVTAPDGEPVQAWIMRSRVGQTDKPRPTVVEVHGGPAAMYGPTFFLEWQIMAGAGYNIVFGNPRGSTGYGRDWSNRIFGDLGGGDFRDVMAITDAAVASGGVDANRLQIEGGSYGGYMTNWAIGQTNRFRSAIAGRSISNLISFWGTSDGGRYMTDEVGGTPWQVTGEYLRRSPISHVEQVRTPLLLMHSDNDLRCPIGQAHEMFNSLSVLGKEVELHISERASHELSRMGSTRQRIIRLHKIRDWSDKHLFTELSAPALAEWRRAEVARIVKTGIELN